MELNYLRYFYEVARQGSFTKASRELHVSQPSISRMVSLLEANVGARLLDRAKRGTSLTEAGRTLYVRCEAIFREVDNFKTDMAGWKQGVRGTLKVAASDNLCHYALPGILESYWTDYPEVRIQLYTGTSTAIQDELLSGRAEVGLFYSSPKSRDLEAESLGDVEFGLVCSPKNKRLGRGRFDKVLLEESWFIGSRSADYRDPYPALELLAKAGIRPNLVFEANSQEVQKRMAMRKIGFTVLPVFMVAEELASGRLIRIRTKRPLSVPLRLVHRKGRTLSRPAQEFIQRLRTDLKTFH